MLTLPARLSSSRHTIPGVFVHPFSPGKPVPPSIAGQFPLGFAKNRHQAPPNTPPLKRSFPESSLSPHARLKYRSETALKSRFVPPRRRRAAFLKKCLNLVPSLLKRLSSDKRAIRALRG